MAAIVPDSSNSKDLLGGESEARTRVSIGVQPGPVVPAALVDAEALGLGRGALVSGRGEAAVDLSAAGSNACEDVHLAGA